MFSFHRDKPIVLPGLTPVCVMASIPSRALCKFVSLFYTWQCLCEFIYIPVYKYIALHLDIVSVNVSVSFTNYIRHCHYKIVSLIYIWVIWQCHSEIVSQLYSYIWCCQCELNLVCLSALHLTLTVNLSVSFISDIFIQYVCLFSYQFKCFWCCFYVLFTCF